MNDEGRNSRQIVYTSEIKHRMTRRLNGWDYCQRAIYSITVTLADRSRPWLGRLNNSLAKNGEAQNGAKQGEAQNGEAQNGSKQGAASSVVAHSCATFISPTPFGEAMVEALKEMPRLYPQVRLIEWFAGDDAVEINYHGMTPSDIDRLAEEAIFASHSSPSCNLTPTSV